MKSQAQAHRRLLLLGLGNDILTDDAVGLRAVKAAGETFVRREGVSVALSSEMGLSLLDEIVGFDDLILVDAVQTRQSPAGFVHEIDEGDLSTLPAISPHFLGVGEVLALGRKLALAVPSRVKILAVEVEDPLTIGTAMTPALEAALPGIVKSVVSAVEAWSGPAVERRTMV